jgi:hypothetical protein
VFEVKIQAGLELVIGNLVASATLVKLAAEWKVKVDSVVHSAISKFVK